MALDCLNLVTPRIPAIAIHLERDVARDRPLAQSSYKEFPELVDGPFCRWRTEDPVRQMGKVEVGHGRTSGEAVG